MADFAPETLQAIGRERQVRLATTGRRTGRPRIVTVWISTDGLRVFIRSGGGLARQWPQNLLASGAGVLRVGGKEIPVRTRHVDPSEGRRVTDLVIRKYGPSVKRSPDDGPPSPAEQATFELTPA